MFKSWTLTALVLADFLFQLALAVLVFFADAGDAVATLIAVAQPLQLFAADAAVVATKAQQDIVGIGELGVGFVQALIGTNGTFCGLAGFFAIETGGLAAERYGQQAGGCGQHQQGFFHGNSFK